MLNRPVTVLARQITDGSEVLRNISECPWKIGDIIAAALMPSHRDNSHISDYIELLIERVSDILAVGRPVGPRGEVIRDDDLGCGAADRPPCPLIPASGLLRSSRP
ncbi:hypothetical protein GCM10009555_041880 [Acrocarpospora macrocephala]|uniref:Uncharacterized protein n=1 Tax=Acrocarpospora macrocephala TaxID=150177 RepID=A0A5M3X0T5_9ACTN|nr:hypothetical protein Amac_073260 [Acrocarpospora macrocephala]